MPRDYIPSKDVDIDDWAVNFSAIITANPTSYGLTSGQASAFATLKTAYSTALAAATNPGTRTPVTVAAKDAARNTMVASARQLAQIAQRYPSITDELLATAGLTVRDSVPSPIPAPTTKPILSLITSNSLQQVLRMKDSVLANPRSRPPGATGMLLYTKVGNTPPASIADCKFQGVYTKVPATVDFAPADAGDNAYHIAQWVNAKGETGPSSDVFMATIAA